MAASVGGIAPPGSFFSPNTPGKPSVVNQDTRQLYAPPPATNPYNLEAPGAVNRGTNAGLALKALQDSSGLNLLSTFNANGTGAGGTGAGGTSPHVSFPDTSAAEAATFNRAKDQAGQNAQGAIAALRGQMAGRGLLGSGVEAGNTRAIIEDTAGGANDITREQAIQHANLGERQAEVGYNGDITQRGQDFQLLEQQRAIQAQQQAQALQGLLSSINASGLLY